MAWIFGDSFAHYDTADILRKWTLASQITIETTGGRANGRCAKMSTSFFGGRLGYYVGGSRTTLICGLRVKPEANAANFFQLMNYANNVTHVTLALNSLGKLVAFRGNNGGTVLGTGTTTIPLNQYSYIEMFLTVSATVGVLTVAVNGLVESTLNLTGINTQSGGSSVVDFVGLGTFTGGEPAGNWRMCDFYLCDSSGSINNTLLGDVRADVIVPNGPGFYQDFTPSTGTDHAALTDEIPPNTTDYVFSSTTGHKDTSTLSDLTGVGNIACVQVNSYVFKSDAGAAKVRNLIRSGSTDATGSALGLALDPLYAITPFETDPETTAAWTLTNVNALQAGIENVT